MRAVSTTTAKPRTGAEPNSRLRKIQVGTPAPNDAVPGLLLLRCSSAATPELLNVCIDLRQALQGRKGLVHNLLSSDSLYYIRFETCKG